MPQTVEDIEGLLREHGHSLTPQRRAILRSLIERGGHRTAAEVLEGITGEFPMASRATVYTTLALLRTLGALLEVPGANGEVRFDANTDPHHHLLCRSCGSIQDVPAEWFPIEAAPGVEVPFEVHRFRVVIEGLCTDCAVRPS